MDDIEHPGVLGCAAVFIIMMFGVFIFGLSRLLVLFWHFLFG